MLFSCLINKQRVLIPLVATVIMLGWLCNRCAYAVEGDNEVAYHLPNLPGPDDSLTAHLDLDEQSASLRYKTPYKKWEATIEQYQNLDPSISFDYGMLLSNKLGIGVNMTRHNNYSELVFNGVYAARPHLRFRVAGAQLRADSLSLYPGDNSKALQSSYLLSARKYWPKERLVSDLGITIYTVDASPIHTGHAPTHTNPTHAVQTAGQAFNGNLDGYLLNVTIRPTWNSKFALRKDISRLSYLLEADVRKRKFIASNHLDYAYSFDNCTKLRGEYSAYGNRDELDLKLSKNQWNIGASRQLHGAGSDTRFYVGITLSLAATENKASHCVAKTTAIAFDPIVDAALKRPVQLPREPIAVREGP